MTAEPMDTGTDALVEAARHGDRDAFAALVDAHYARMFAIALKFCGNRSDAEDITQQACVRLGRGIRQFRGDAAFTTWLYRLVINSATDWYRNRSPADERSAPEPVSTARGDDLVLLGQVLERIGEMGEGFREAVVLVLGEGLTHAEVAAVLDVRESTVSWRIHEVRKRLAALMEEGL